jgi:hypothetical protein
VLAVEGQLAFERVERVLELARPERQLPPERVREARGSFASELGVGADELLGVEGLAGVDASQPAIRMEVDPRVDALGGLVGEAPLVRRLEQLGQRMEQAIRG